IVVLWTTPRSRSTAFERMMIERGDHTVFDEPFSVPYYFSAERRSNRYSERAPDADAATVLDRLVDAAATRPVFVKEMAHHASGLLTPAFLGRFTNTFLVRAPRAALGSFAARWPDLTEEEAGYGRLLEAFRVVQQLGRTPPIVLESDEVTDDPPALVRAWCDAIGIPFIESALRWEPGMQPQWERWHDWYEGVARTTGFVPRPPDAPTPLDERVNAIAARAQPVYDELAAVRLRDGHTSAQEPDV
ncbi:MAG TPA: hypothetical protein VFF40_11325, partial [Acidimicrobiia bacterium]|nr:hypothetical protein [Acidimicrobiia bacterium]